MQIKLVINNIEEDLIVVSLGKMKIVFVYLSNILN
jgi:hypothetical protein